MTNRRVLVAFGVALILASLAAAAPRTRSGEVYVAPPQADRTIYQAIELPQGFKQAPHQNLAGSVFSQSANGYYGISSQNFEAAYAAYDSYIADDFTATAGWTIDQATFPGIFWNGYSFQIDGVNVWFYQDSGNHPGTQVCFYQGVVPTSGGANANITVQFCGSPCQLTAGTHYWVAVQPDLAFGPYGQWGSYSHTPVTIAESNWKNPAGGFGVGCLTYSFRCSVCGVGCGSGDYDQAFELFEDMCSGGGGQGGGGGDCDLTPIEAKLDDETRFTDDSELAVIEGKLDNINVSVDWCELIDLLLPLLHETLPTTHPCYP